MPKNAKQIDPVKFAHLAEKSGKGSISNLSTKVEEGDGDEAPAGDALAGEEPGGGGFHTQRLI